MKKTAWTTLLLSLAFWGTQVCPVHASDILSLPASVFDGQGVYAPSVTSLENNRVLLTYRQMDGNSTVEVLDTERHTVVWVRTLKLYDCKVMTHPSKIVLLTEDRNALNKLVLGYDGKLLGSDPFQYRLKVPTGVGDAFWARWSAPEPGIPEGVAVAADDQLRLYQSPWKTSRAGFNLELKPSEQYDDISLVDVQVASYPYAVAEYQGSGIGSTTYILRGINLLSKKEYSLAFGSDQRLGGHGLTYRIVDRTVGRIAEPNTELNTDRAAGAELLVGTSHIERLGATLSFPEAPQPVYSRYRLDSGQQLSSRSAAFVSDQAVYGWQTELLDHTVWVQDLNDYSWRLFSGDGLQTMPLAVGKTGDTPLLVLQVDLRERRLTFLAPSGGGKAVMRTEVF